MKTIQSKDISLAFILVVMVFQAIAQAKQTNHAMLNDETFRIYVTSDDPTYGFSFDNPVKVGGASTQEGPLNERRFLNALLGPDGQKIKYSRLGSDYKMNGTELTKILDIYEVKYRGLKKPLKLYIDMYEFRELKAPVGFTFKTE